MTITHNWPPVAHSHDPQTSKLAEREITDSGKRETDADKVLRMVGAVPGLTSFELAGMIDGLTLYAVRRRLSDLKHQGAVEQGDAVARDGQRSMLTWWLPRVEPVQLQLLEDAPCSHSSTT